MKNYFKLFKLPVFLIVVSCCVCWTNQTNKMSIKNALIQRVIIELDGNPHYKTLIIIISDSLRIAELKYTPYNVFEQKYGNVVSVNLKEEETKGLMEEINSLYINKTQQKVLGRYEGLFEEDAQPFRTYKIKIEYDNGLEELDYETLEDLSKQGSDSVSHKIYSSAFVRLIKQLDRILENPELNDKYNKMLIREPDSIFMPSMNISPYIMLNKK